MFQQGEGPLFFEHPLGRQVVGRFEAIAGLGIEAIQGNDRAASSAFLSMGAVPLVGKKMLQRRQQKGAKAALFPRNVVQEVLAEQSCEEFLREVLGLVDLVSTA